MDEYYWNEASYRQELIRESLLRYSGDSLEDQEVFIFHSVKNMLKAVN